MAARPFPAEVGLVVGDNLKTLRINQSVWRPQQPQLKSVEIIATECSLKNSAELLEIGGDLELFGGPANRQVVDENKALLKGALGDAAQFAEFQIVQVLHAHPYPDTQHCQHQAQGAARGPEQKKAQHGKDRRHAIKNGDHLPLRKTSLQKFVVDVLAVPGKYRPAADEPAR